MKKLAGAVRTVAASVLFFLRTGTTHRTMLRVLREVSSLCLPPTAPGKCRLPDGFTISVVTTLWFMRIDVAGNADHPGPISYWVDREKLVVHMPGYFGEEATVPLEHRNARRVLYALKCFRKWCPIPMTFDGVKTPDGVVLPTGAATSEHLYQKVIHE